MLSDKNNSPLKYKEYKPSTVDHDEVNKFEKLANRWWDENGEYSILHIINPIRIAYIRDNILKAGHTTLAGIKILDVGCGGGLVALPLARLGADVTAIDASTGNIEAAKAYAWKQEVKVIFKATSSEELATTKVKFDVIVAMEIIEHVADVDLFMKSLVSMLKPGGLLFISTINRTLKAKFMAKLLAEYVLHWVPKGTHDFKKFITPGELKQLANKYQLKELDSTGLKYSPLSKSWKLSPHDLSINYMALYSDAIRGPLQNRRAAK